MCVCLNTNIYLHTHTQLAYTSSIFATHVTWLIHMWRYSPLLDGTITTSTELLSVTCDVCGTNGRANAYTLIYNTQTRQFFGAIKLHHSLTRKNTHMHMHSHTHTHAHTQTHTRTHIHWHTPIHLHTPEFAETASRILKSVNLMAPAADIFSSCQVVWREGGSRLVSIQRFCPHKNWIPSYLMNNVLKHTGSRFYEPNGISKESCLWYKLHIWKSRVTHKNEQKTFVHIWNGYSYIYNICIYVYIYMYIYLHKYIQIYI